VYTKQLQVTRYMGLRAPLGAAMINERAPVL
jgi:hypothetical protein